MNKVEDVNYNIDSTYCIGRYFGLDRIGNKSQVPEIRNTPREYFCCLNARVSEVWSDTVHQKVLKHSESEKYMEFTFKVF